MHTETITYRIIDATNGRTVYRDLKAINPRSAVLRFRRRCMLAHNYPHVVAIVQTTDTPGAIPDTDLSWLPEGGAGLDRRVSAKCALCGEAYSAHRTASGNTAPYCMSKFSRTGDTFVRDSSKGGAR